MVVLRDAGRGLPPSPHRWARTRSLGSSGSTPTPSSRSRVPPTSPAARRGPEASPRTRTVRSTSCSGITRTGSRPDLTVLASRTLPRRLPYNSFVILPDGHLVTKDFGGVLPGHDPAAHAPDAAELLALDPGHARDRRPLRAAGAVDRAPLGRRRHGLRRRHVDACSACTGTATRLDARRPISPRSTARSPGQTYGWDAVLALGAAWFLDNGEGSERYVGHVPRPGHLDRAAAPRARRPRDGSGHAHRDLRAARTVSSRTRPSSTTSRRIVVGYDSGNGVLAAFDIAADGSTTPRWRREQNHACHPLLFPDTGELVTNDHDATRMADVDRRARHRDRATSACGSTPAARCNRCCSRRPASAATSTTARLPP